jgi:hypothetical protein
MAFVQLAIKSNLTAFHSCDTYGMLLVGIMKTHVKSAVYDPTLASTNTAPTLRTLAKSGGRC